MITEVTTTETIDGLAYTSTKMPAVRQLGLLARATKMLGEHGLRVLVGAGGDQLAQLFPGIASAASDGRVFAAVVQLAEGIDGDPWLFADVLAATKCSALRPLGVPGPITRESFDAHFSGELPHLLRVIVFVLRHNLAGFTIGSH